MRRPRGGWQWRRVRGAARVAPGGDDAGAWGGEIPILAFPDYEWGFERRRTGVGFGRSFCRWIGVIAMVAMHMQKGRICVALAAVGV